MTNKECKINLQVAISRNFDKVVLGINEEPVPFDTEEQFRANVRRLFAILNEEVEEEYKKIQKPR